MRTRSVVLLVVLAVLAATAAFLAGGHGPSAQPTGTGEPLLPGLSARLNDVAAINVLSQDDHFTVRLVGDAWQVVERGGYPAKFETVKKTLIALSELRTVEPKTSNPELYERLGVEDPESPDSDSALVTLLDKDGQALAAVIVGHAGGQRDTHYVRRASDAQSWLVRGSLMLERKAAQWMGNEAYKLPSSRIRSVLTAHADGEQLLVSRDAESESNLQLRDVPEGMQPRTSNIGRIQHTVLDPLNFDDVAAASAQPLPGDDVVTTTFETFDGLKVVVTTAKEPRVETPEGQEPVTPRTWARLEVSALPDAPEAVQSEAQAAQERLAPWVFALPSWKGENLRKRMADMISPVQPAVEPADDALGTLEPAPADTAPPDEPAEPPAEGAEAPQPPAEPPDGSTDPDQP